MDYKPTKRVESFITEMWTLSITYLITQQQKYRLLRLHALIKQFKDFSQEDQAFICLALGGATHYQDIIELLEGDIDEIF